MVATASRDQEELRAARFAIRMSPAVLMLAGKTTAYLEIADC
jgi:hypothetical protein